MATLVITVNGPFAYHDADPASGYLTLMAPMCPQHIAGIARIEANNQIILPYVNCRNHAPNLGGCAPHRYELRPVIGQLNSGACTSNCLLRVVNTKPFEPREWRFWLKLPRPDSFVDINPVQAHVFDPAGANLPALNSYAIGMRFIYSKWDGQMIPLFHESVAVPDPINPANSFSFKFKPGTDLAFLEIDYSSPLRDDVDHEDAVNCFENIMTPLGLRLSIYIPKSVAVGHLEASKMNDCKAAIAYIS